MKSLSQRRNPISPILLPSFSCHQALEGLKWQNNEGRRMKPGFFNRLRNEWVSGVSLFSLFLLLLATPLHAGPRSSASYTVQTDSADKGGARSASAAYSHSGSVGDVVGIATVASTTAKQGYLGQLYEVTTLQLAAGAASLNELSTLPLSAAPVLDDLTTFMLTAPEVAWSVQTGALTGVDANGLATAATVYQNSAAVAAGSYAGITGTLNLTVLDSIADNFGGYAGDRLADAWQVQNFGLNNSHAGPNADPDGDGSVNTLEFAFGTDPFSGLTGTLAHAAGILTQRGQPITSGQYDAVFLRRSDYLSAGLIYTVEFSGDLVIWTPSTTTPTLLASDAEMQAVSVPYPPLARFFRVSVRFAP